MAFDGVRRNIELACDLIDTQALLSAEFINKPLLLRKLFQRGFYQPAAFMNFHHFLSGIDGCCGKTCCITHYAFPVGFSAQVIGYLIVQDPENIGVGTLYSSQFGSADPETDKYFLGNFF